VSWRERVEDGRKKLVVNDVRKKRKAKISHDFHRGSFSGRTFYLLDCTPSYLVLFAFPPVERERWAHIPHERGGAPCGPNSTIVDKLGGKGGGGRKKDKSNINR